MKKLLLTFIMAVAFISAKAVTATVYVKAEKAPFLYGWYTINGVETKINGKWPGVQMSSFQRMSDKDHNTEEFWYQTFELEGTSSFNIIFNNGQAGVDKMQTGNIADVSSDRFFILNEEDFTYTDVTENYGVEIPDVEIQSVALLSELNEWDGMAQLFTETEKNKTYTYNLSLSDEELDQIEYFYRFKIMVNSSAYLGWDTEGLVKNDPNSWLEQDTGEGGGTNFGIDFDKDNMPHTVLFTMSFAGGKNIYDGWTISVADGTSGIHGIASDPATKVQPRYTLSGQRVGNGYKGIVVSNGKKMLMK